MTILRLNYYIIVIIKSWIVIIIFLWITEVFHKFKHLSADVLWKTVDKSAENMKISSFFRKNEVWITVDKFGENWG